MGRKKSSKAIRSSYFFSKQFENKHLYTDWNSALPELHDNGFINRSNCLYVLSIDENKL